MKNLMLSTAILAGMTGAVLAQDATMTGMFRPAADPMELRASEFIGMRVYASEAAVDAEEYAGMQEDWADIGEINDVILSRDGAVDAVLVDIGGFLGMGERQVAVGMESIRFVADSSTADAAEDFFLVMAATRADFEAAPDYNAGVAPMTTDETSADPAVVPETDAAATTTTETAADTTVDPATTAPAADAMQTETATDATVAVDPAVEATADATTETVREPMVRDGYIVADAEYLTSEKLTGARVYDANDEWIGDVSDLVMSDQGQVTQAVVDVGGFLGMGAKPVMLELSEIDILRNDAGDEVRVYLAKTKDELKAMPTYEG